MVADLIQGERIDMRIADPYAEGESLPAERLSPHSFEAEQALIGSVLIAPDIMPGLAHLPHEAFFILSHQLIWRALRNIYDRGDAIDDLILIDEMETSGALDKIGGPALVTHLIANTPTYIHATSYAAIVERAYTRRKLIIGASKIVAAAQNPNMNIGDVIQEVGDVINPLVGEVHRNSLQVESAHEVFSRVYGNVEAWNNDKQDIRGWHLGMPDVDRAFGGIENGTLTGVIAHTGQGKSTLMGSVILALAQQGAGIVCPTEMPTDQYALRLLAFQAGTSGSVLRKGRADADTHRNVVNAFVQLASTSIDFLPGKPTPAQLYAIAESKQQQGKCDWIVIDGLHDMTPSDRKASGIYEKITDIIEGVHAISVGLKIPVFFTLHVSRGASTDMSKPPTLQQALGSSRIEQLLSQAIVLWRPGGLVEQGALARLPDGYGPESTDIIIAKSRLEKTGARLKMRLVQNGKQFGFFPEVR